MPEDVQPRFVEHSALHLNDDRAMVWRDGWNATCYKCNWEAHDFGFQSEAVIAAREHLEAEHGK